MARDSKLETYMCGTCGIYGECSKSQIKKMADSLVHRGPDDDGYFFDKNAGLGFRRLAIIDLKTGHQPIFNEYKDVCVIFNGEIYNYRQLRQKLEKAGHRFHTKTDTETIVHAYEQYGEEQFANQFNGMFAIAIYDSGKKKLVLARDRVGIKPVYYAISDDGKLVFGSEIKAILRSGELEPELDKDAVSSYFLFGTVFGEKTLFKGIKRLLPGHALVAGKNGIRVFRYLDYAGYDYAAKPDAALPITPQYLRKVLERSVESQMVADVPVGAYLSGGLDSSTVVALMKKSNENLKTFNIGFGREDDESSYARLVAESIGTDHHEIFIYPDEIPKVLSDFIYHYDDLNWDAAALPVYKLSKYAKKYVTVVLTGEGGDELFGGYNRYKFFSDYFWFVPAQLKRMFYNRFLKFADESTLRNIVKEPAGYGQKIYDSYFDGHGKPVFQGVLDFELNETLPNQLLTKADRATMAGSIEGRVPLLDNEMLEFSSQTPLSMKLKGFNGKFILKAAVGGLLPKITIKRAKRGFGASPYNWFREREVMDFATGVLDQSQVREEYVNMQAFKKLLGHNGISKGRKANTLWMLLCFELWYRKFLL